MRTLRQEAVRGGVARLVQTGEGYSALLVRSGVVVARVDHADGAVAMARLKAGEGRVPAAKAGPPAPAPASGHDLADSPYAPVARRILEADGAIFLTGRAGSGKTTFLRALLDATELRSVVVAPSGIAALNAGGQTAHSLFKLPPALIRPEDLRRVRDGRMLRSLDLLVIDEVSMVRSDLMDAIDRSMRLHRGSSRPFGGVKLLCVGDSAQLPPVVQSDEVETLQSWYGGPYFFDAPGARQVDWTAIELAETFRQSDRDFLDILDRLRRGRPTRADAERLDTLVRDTPDSAGAGADVGDGIVLTTTNEAARRINDREMALLPGPQTLYAATVEGQFDARLHPTDADLALRPGARVMLVRNDPDRRWVNGTLGVVESLSPRAARVRIGGRVYEVEAAAWERHIYEPDTDGAPKRKVAGTFRQLPLRPAWALTIHKAQGLTFDRVHVDFGRGAFAHGQTYVALSRCRSLEGLTLSRHLRRSDIVVDDRAFAFVDRATWADFGPFRAGRIEMDGFNPV